MPFSLQTVKNKRPLVIKKTVQESKPAPKQVLTKRTVTTSSSSSQPNPTARVSKSDARRSYPTPPAERPNRDRKRSTPARTPNSPQILDFGNDSDDGSDEDALRAVKRPRIATPEDLPARKVRSGPAFAEDGEHEVDMIHGEEIRSLDTKVKYQSAFDGLPVGSKIELQYPSAANPERFELVKGKKAPDYNALEDIHATMKMVAKYYLPADMHERFDNESTGFPQRLNRAVNKRNAEDLRHVIKEWNEEMVRLRKDGTFAQTLDGLRRIPAELVERVLSQAHMRTVSPEDHLLHTYQAGSNEVYGELLPRFVSQILNQDTKMNSDQVFIDLGSGVGNVVLQVALEAGCESWGCEIKPEYCELAESQQKEFEARCRLWGLAHGEVHLERGNFINNGKIRDALRRADVLVVNNEVFSSKLNEELSYLFLDLKEGCRIVSLKSFVPDGHKISTRNAHSPVNILKVVKKEYFSGSVSWKDRAGDYFISTKDSTVQQSFLEADK